jgi:hypothetical protein
MEPNMPVNTELASKIWYRYQFARDNGHADYITKADICEKFFAGDQWTTADLQSLKSQLRPALTINKIISTIGNVMGEQIYNRSEIGFRPASGADPATADVLNKVFKQISNNNQLDWRRSDAFADGIITSRGFLDVRMDFTDNVQGEVRITNINPKNVIIDPDAEEHDPDSWNEVQTTKWVTADDIAILYSKADADLLRNREQSFFPYGYDSIEATRDRFGYTFVPGYGQGSAYEMSSVLRNLRVIERQHRVLDRQKHFIDPKNGDTRPVPEGWDRNRIALVTQQFGWDVVPKLVKRIRWSVISDNVVLHDDWSPYDHFTIVPYFPVFRRGKTIGLVENLVGPQELLNKVSSQELHVVNSSANSGWKIKTGGLINMSLEELEQKGAQTGLVLELDELDSAEKITPNGTPQGLDRISYKAEEHIKTISGISDSQQGMDREDVAAKAIQAKRQAASTNMAKPLDSLVRTDFMLARNILSLVQKFYTDERIITIESPHGAGEPESVTINAAQPDGSILNDLTLGEYHVVISSVPQRETLEDSQFDQAVSMRKDLGIAIPDEFIIENSRLMNKKDLIKAIADAKTSPEAQAAAQLQQAQLKADVDKTNAETGAKQADAQLKAAKAQKEGVATQKEAATPIEQEQGDGGAALMKAQADIALDQQKFEHQKELDMQRLAFEREKMDAELQMKAQAQAQKAAADRIAAAQKPAAPTNPAQGAPR